MASGFGAFTPTGRCTHLWNSFTTCMSECASPDECKLKKEDYLECLSNKKTVRGRAARHVPRTAHQGDLDI